MGAAALPIAAIGVSGLGSIVGGFQQAQAGNRQAAALERQSELARQQAQYQQDMAEREADEIKRRAAEDKADTEAEYKRLRASQAARMGASGFSSGSPLSSLSSGKLTSALDKIDADADYQAGTSLLSGGNAAWSNLQNAADYQSRASQVRSDRTTDMLSDSLSSVHGMLGDLQGVL